MMMTVIITAIDGDDDDYDDGDDDDQHRYPLAMAWLAQTSELLRILGTDDTQGALPVPISDFCTAYCTCKLYILCILWIVYYCVFYILSITFHSNMT